MRSSFFWYVRNVKRYCVLTFRDDLSNRLKDQAVQESVKVAGCCEYGNELSDCMKYRGILRLAKELVVTQGRFCSVESVVRGCSRGNSTADAKVNAGRPSLGLPAGHAGQTLSLDPEHRTKHLL
jgi:hypothetical protein